MFGVHLMQYLVKIGVSGAIRTHDILLRREALYPAELRRHFDLKIISQQLSKKRSEINPV